MNEDNTELRVPYGMAVHDKEEETNFIKSYFKFFGKFKTFLISIRSLMVLNSKVYCYYYRSNLFIFTFR